MHKFRWILLLILQTNLIYSTFAQRVDSINVYFNTDEFILLIQEQQKIRSYFQEIDSDRINKVSILAYCDDRGTYSYNQILSNNRAKQVENFLLELGFNEILISDVQGNGEFPLLDSIKLDIEKQRALNRHALIEISYLTDETPKFNVDVLEKLNVGDKIVLENILFEGGRRILLPESYPVLEALIKFMKEHENYNIEILGHICCLPLGNDGLDWDTGIYNLSIVRAETIYNILIENGINSNRLSYKGLGSNFPLGKGDKFDRRVEIRVTDK